MSYQQPYYGQPQRQGQGQAPMAGTSSASRNAPVQQGYNQQQPAAHYQQPMPHPPQGYPPQQQAQQQAPPETQRFGPYIVGETIGRGSFGKVKIAIHETTGVKVALKVIARKAVEADARSKLKLQREIRVLRLLKHPHIMRLYDVVQTRNDIVLVLELVSGGELFVYLARRGRLEESHARMYFQQLIAAMAHCHNAGVVHRDLKPENILVEGTHRGVKIADFGLSSVAYDGKLFETSCGTPNYAAPEVVSGRVYVGKEADIWSAGVVLFTMVAGTLPFDDEHLSQLFRKIQTASYTMPAFLSPQAQDLISKILVVNPLDRATTAQILNHPWVRQSFPPYLALLHGESLAENSIFPSKYHPHASSSSPNESFSSSAVRGAGLDNTPNPGSKKEGGSSHDSASHNATPNPGTVEGDYYRTEAAKLSSSYGPTAGINSSSNEVSSSTTPAVEGTNPLSTLTSDQLSLAEASEKLRKRDAYRNVIDLGIVVQLCERFKVSSRKVTDQLISHPTGQYTLNTQEPRHTLVDKKVADSIIVTIPSADEALRSEQHDMCISYSILLDKKRNQELNEYKKQSAQWANQTPSPSGENQPQSSGGLAPNQQPLLQPSEVVARTQTTLDHRRAATMVQDGSPEAKARMGGHHLLGTYRSQDQQANSSTISPFLKFVDPMHSIPSSFGWGSVSQLAGGSSAGYQLHQPHSHTNNRDPYHSVGSLAQGPSSLLLRATDSNTQASQPFLLTPAGPGPQRIANMMSMQMSLNPQSLQFNSTAHQQQHLGMGAAAGGALAGYGGMQIYSNNNNNGSGVSNIPIGLPSAVVLTDELYLKTYNALMGTLVAPPPLRVAAQVTTPTTAAEAQEDGKALEHQQLRRDGSPTSLIPILHQNNGGAANSHLDPNDNSSSAHPLKSPNLLATSAPRRMKSRLPHLVSGPASFTGAMAPEPFPRSVSTGAHISSEALVPISQQASNSTAPQSVLGVGYIPAATAHAHRGPTNPLNNSSSQHMLSPKSSISHLPQQPLHSFYHDGVLFKGQASPNAVMAMVYDLLQEKGFVWTVMKPFQLACVAFFPLPIKLFVRVFRAVERQPDFIVDVRLSTRCVGTFGGVDVAASLLEGLAAKANPQASPTLISPTTAEPTLPSVSPMASGTTTAFNNSAAAEAASSGPQPSAPPPPVAATIVSEPQHHHQEFAYGPTSPDKPSPMA